MKLVLIGAPAAGKGTQARRLVAQYNLAYISTGDMLREQISKKTELGLAVKHVIASGGLVPDDLIVEIVKTRIQEDDCKNGFILDGFPRTQVQAEELDEIVGKIDRAIYINVPDDVMLDRLTVRQSCPKCGSSYNKVSNPTKVKGICDVCGTELKQRKDDNYESGVSRIKTFHDSSEPVVEYYKNKNLLFEVDGLGNIDDITKLIVSNLGERA